MHDFASPTVEDPENHNSGPEATEFTGGHPTSPSTAELSGAEMIAAQQLGNVGLLAAGLAHDLNNLLTVILGSAELARDATPAQSPARHHLRTIELTVRRAGEMCRTMLACARTDRHDFEPVDANAVVRDTVALLRTSRLARHRVRIDLAPQLPAVPANPAQLRQIVLNLLANAAEACGTDGGRIRISTMATELDARAARHLRPAGPKAGRFLRLRVADDGCGMDEATQKKLFTPFFTRKSHGRGLGLASLLEIARVHGGGVRVFSEPDRGSIFDVFLPLSSTVAESRDERESAPPGAPSFSERPLHGSILVADDEEILRQSLVTFLRSQGLTVHSVENGEEALAHLQNHPETELVLIDLMMPKLGGLEALIALRENGRRIPAIVMTGHADVAIADQLAGLEPAVVLAKPFSLVELVRLISEYLPQRAGTD